jgi:hypothetical protein
MHTLRFLEGKLVEQTFRASLLPSFLPSFPTGDEARYELALQPSSPPHHLELLLLHHLHSRRLAVRLQLLVIPVAHMQTQVDVHEVET